MFKFILSIIGVFALTACQIVSVDAPEYRSLPVKDVPLSGQLGSDSSYKRKILLLPILSHQIDQETLGKIENNFTSSLVQSNLYQVVRPRDINLDPNRYLTNENKYNIDKLTKKVKTLDIQAFFIVIVEDIKYSTLGGQLGVLREIQNKLDAKTRVAIVSTGTKNDVFKTLKESSVVMKNQRMLTKPGEDKKVFADPYMVELAISNALSEVVPLANKSVAQLVWEGRVAGVEGGRIILNVGRRSGVKIGDILKVTAAPKEVFDPQKGESIGKVPGMVKATVEVKGYVGDNGAVANIHSGAGIQVNDKVEVY